MNTLFALLIPLCVPALVTAQTPQQIADDRLAADRAFSAASVKTNLVPLSREGQAALIVAKMSGLDEPLVAQVVERLMADLQVVFRRDSEGAGGGEGAAVFAVQFVDAIAIHDQLALLAARQGCVLRTPGCPPRLHRRRWCGNASMKRSESNVNLEVWRWAAGLGPSIHAFRL